MSRLERIKKSRICLFSVNPRQEVLEVYSDSVGPSSVYAVITTLPFVAQRIKVYGEKGDVCIGSEKIHFLFVDQDKYHSASKKGEDALIEYAHTYAEIASHVLQKQPGKLWIFGPDALLAMIQEICDKDGHHSHFDHSSEQFDFEYFIVFSYASRERPIPDAVTYQKIVCLS